MDGSLSDHIATIPDGAELFTAGAKLGGFLNDMLRYPPNVTELRRLFGEMRDSPYRPVYKHALQKLDRIPEGNPDWAYGANAESSHRTLGSLMGEFGFERLE